MRSIFMKPALAVAVLSLGACGEKDEQQESRVAYRDGKGIASSSDGARSVVRLDIRSSEGLDRPYCSGVLVHPNVVLTAAHCIVSVDERNAVVGPRMDPTAIKVRLSNGTQTTGTRADYPKNYAIAYSHVDGLDIGYIVLKQPAPANLAADVATLEEFKTWATQFAAKAKGISYGKTAEAASTGGFLNTLDVPFVGFFGPRKDPVTLDIRPASTPENQARPLEFMAGFDNMNACHGDSGGGLFISVAGKLKLAGITSRTINPPQFGEPCGLGTLSTIYAFAETALTWSKRSAPDAFGDPEEQ